MNILKTTKQFGKKKLNSMCDSANKNNNNIQPIAVGLPQWIEAKLFENILTEVESEFKEIQAFKVDYALAPGENYASLMLKVEIVMKLKDDSSKPISFILKVGHDNEIFREMSKTHDMFAVESGMYHNIVPELEQMYLEAGVQVKFGAKAYALPTDQSYILLENLKIQGFRNANRLEGLDMIHVKSALKKMAQWHAASATRVALKGQYPHIYCTSFYKPESSELVKSFYDSPSKALLDCLKEYSNSHMYYEKVAKLQSQLADELCKNVVESADEFCVLNHGDCWSNNIMFQYDGNGKLLETYWVDYQVPRFGSPAQDLLYFILSSSKYEIKLQDFDYFISYYHGHLEENLKLLKYPKKIPTVKDLHCILFKDGIWGYFAVAIVMSAVLCDPCDNASLDNILSDSEEGLALKRQMFSNERYRKHMEAALPWLLNRGLLDY